MKFRLKQATLVDGEVANPGIFDRSVFSDAQFKWLNQNKMIEAVDEAIKLSPVQRKKRTASDDTSQAE